MSGPKVVRVVSREERIERCESLLAQLDAAVRALKADASRFGDSEGEALAKSSVRREALAELVRNDSFDQAEVQVRQELSFILSKRNEVIERATSAAATARRQLSSQRHAATTLLQELQRRAPEAHAELAASLRQIADQSKATEAAGFALAEAMLALSPATPSSHLSEDQKALARSLQVKQDSGLGSDSWQSLAAQDKRIVDLQHRLAQIDVFSDTQATAEFTQRLEAIAREGDGAFRNIKLDALVIEVAATVERLRRLAGVIQAARSALAEVDVLGSATELASVRQELQAAIDDTDETRLKSATADATRALDLARAALAAKARREAILGGLATLGYQVNESMATSWVDDGRVVLRKADADMHGVEIASASDAQRLQVRAVAFSPGLPGAANLAAETAWCGDFGRLQQHLQQHAGDLAIERALPVGAVPLKVVKAPDLIQQQATMTRTLKINGTQ